MNVEANNPTNTNVEADGKRAFEMPVFELPKMAMPGVFLEIAEQGAVRLKENCEKMKAASGEMAAALRETCSTNAKASADYGAKVIEISSVNTNSAFDFLTSLIGTKSVSEVIKLSAGKRARTSTSHPRRIWNFGASLRKSRQRLPSRSRRASLGSCRKSSESNLRARQPGSVGVSSHPLGCNPTDRRPDNSATN